jgi:hypothetical protein
MVQGCRGGAAAVFDRAPGEGGKRPGLGSSPALRLREGFLGNVCIGKVLGIDGKEVGWVTRGLWEGMW